MIQQETVLKVTDNSGAKIVKCIKVLGGFKRKFAYTGDTIIITVKTVKKVSKVQKGQICKAVILRTKEKIKKKDGCSFFLSQNSVSLISKQRYGRKKVLSPIASRIVGPLAKKLAINFKEFTKICGGLL